MCTILWHGVSYGVFTRLDAVKSLREFYPGGDILPA